MRDRRLFSRYIFRIDLDLSYFLQSLPRLKTDTLQRSDGEDEEDGSLTLSPIGHTLLPDNKLPDWEGLTIPFPGNFEQEGQGGVSVSLGDLVRQMHPYCMTISVENEEGEHILPEGGILLEVVDQGENGEPILAIPDMDLPVSFPCKEQSENEDKLSDDASDSLENVIINDNDDVIHSNPPANVASPLNAVSLDTKGEMVITRQKKKSPSWKKKKKTKTKCQPKPVDGMDLQVHPQKVDKLVKEGTKDNVAKMPSGSALPLPVEPNPSPSLPHTDIACSSPEPEMNEQVQTSASLGLQKVASNTSPDASGSVTVACMQQSTETPGHPDPVSKEMESSSAPPLVPSDTPASPSQPISPDVSDGGPPPVAPSFTEPKPKSLSLAEYRQLRQQKKPNPVEKIDASNSSKWPSLPVLPKELPPIPCLSNPSARDPRRTNPHTGRREVEEVKPAWQPRGPCAPPTPEALLVPPAYMVSSTSKVPAVKPQQTPELSKSPFPKTSPHPAPNSTVHTAPPALQGSSSDPIKSEKHFKSPTSSVGESRPALLEGNGGFNQRLLQIKTCPGTTTEEVKAAAAPTSAPVSSEKTPTFFTKGQEVGACTVTGGATATRRMSSKASDPTLASAAHASDRLALKVEPALSENQDNLCTEGKAQKPKTPPQELIKAFTSEIGEFRFNGMLKFVLHSFYMLEQVLIKLHLLCCCRY